MKGIMKFPYIHEEWVECYFKLYVKIILMS